MRLIKDLAMGFINDQVRPDVEKQSEALSERDKACKKIKEVTADSFVLIKSDKSKSAKAISLGQQNNR